MDWWVCDSLYSIFKTWNLKCEIILEVELASLADARSVGQFSDGQGTSNWCTRLDAWAQVKSALKLSGKDGKSSASHRPMKWGQDMTWNHSHKLNKMWMSGTTKFSRNCFFVDSHKKAQAFYPGTFSCWFEDQEFLANCLLEASINWTTAWVR